MDNLEISSFIIENETKNKVKLDSKEKKVRYYFFDNFKGILIFTVVFTHFLFGYTNLNFFAKKIVVFIYSFHMEGFIFISGFVTSENSTRIDNVIKLLILYYIFNYTFSLLIYLLFNSQINFLYPKYSYWYLLSLFYWRISIKFFNNFECIIILSIAVSLLEGYWNCFSNVLSIRRTIAFFPYFLLGYKLKKNKFLLIILKWRKGLLKTLLIIFCFLLFLFIIINYLNINEFPGRVLLMERYNEKNGVEKRVAIMIISFLMILFNLLLLPNKKMPFITKYGKNTLYIYLFHRIFPLIAQKYFFIKEKFFNHIIEYSIFFSLIIIVIFGTDFLTNLFNSILDSILKNFTENTFKGKIISFSFSFSFILLLLINPLSINISDKKHNKKFEISKLSKEFKEKEKLKECFNNSIRITFIGDLILLKDQVISAKNNLTGKYEFDQIFEYTSKHFHESDLTIGVYEGPSAGNHTNYSTSNYADGTPLYLNFPDEFAEAVKKAGINLVTTATNHLLDKKIEGAFRTLDILDKYNISHVGSYRNQNEKDKDIIINIKGLKIAVLAYTSNMNHFNMDYLYKNYKYLTRIIPKNTSKFYDIIYEEIKNDFKKVKKNSPDIIIVLAHMGTQFIHNSNEFQDKWNQIFTDLGADIIFGDHSHSIQPLLYKGNTFIVNSPGNFANSFIKYDGDSTAMIDIFINNQTKKILGASAIPMFTKEIKPKYFSAIPIYELINNKHILLTDREWKRIQEIQLMSTKVLVGKEFSIKEAKKNYFFINNTYYDFEENLNNLNNFCVSLQKYDKKAIFNYISNSKSITFIGDSITKGTKNNHHPWYEPIISCFKNKEIINISKGSYTTKLIISKFKNDIIKTKSDLYIIAIGTNDIRYRDKNICSMDKKEYINQIEIIVNLAKFNNHKAKFVFISPWFSTFDDNVSKLKYNKRKRLMKEYSIELRNYSKENKYLFIEPNKYLEKNILKNPKKYLVDFIHPNSKDGIKLYCKAIFESE